MLRVRAPGSRRCLPCMRDPDRERYGERKTREVGRRSGARLGGSRERRSYGPAVAGSGAGYYICGRNAVEREH